jgi:hypothetical protein
VDTINDGTAADITFTNSATDLSANWSAASDVNSAIDRYWYAIGTTPGATNVKTWTDNWFNRSVTATGLSLVNGQIYYFSVKAEDGAGLVSTVFTSNGQTVQLGLGITEQDGLNTITVSPNPFSNTTNLSYNLTENSKITISLFDVLGKEIVIYNNSNQTSGKHDLTINSAELQLAKGMYFVKLKTNKDLKTLKVVLK